MFRDATRAVLAAVVLWPIMPPRPAPVPASPPVVAWAPAPVPAWAPPPVGPVRRAGAAVLDAADRLANRWLP